jgi:hypothetical protein
MTAADFKPSAEKFDNLGLSFQDFVDVMNSNIDESIQTNDSDIVLGGLLQYEVSVFSYLLEVSTMCSSYYQHRLTYAIDGLIAP